MADELEDTFPGLVVEGVERTTDESERGKGALEVRMGVEEDGEVMAMMAMMTVGVDELSVGGMARVVDAIRGAMARGP